VIYKSEGYVSYKAHKVENKSRNAFDSLFLGVLSNVVDPMLSRKLPTSG